MFRTRLLVTGGVSSLLALGWVPVAGAESTTPPASSTMVAVDVAASAGLRVAHSRTWSAAPHDYNRDGAQDVLINYHGYAGGVHKASAPGAKLWRNNGNGRYRRVAKYAWRSGNSRRRLIDRHNCDWADVDRNGRVDLYCSAGRTENNVVKHGRDNELWLQDRRGRFREVGTAWRAGDPCGRGRHVAFLDANGDRFPDLFVGNDIPRKRPDPCDHSALLPSESSKLLINVRGRSFRRAPAPWTNGRGQGDRCAEVLDYNGDGWDDLFTCGRAGTTPHLYTNQGGRGFADNTPASLAAERPSDAVVTDLDEDGDPDLVTAAFGEFGYHLNDNAEFGPKTVIASVPGPGRGWAVAVGDAEGDGDVDVYGMVEQGLYRNADDWIWLNESLGFTRVRVPRAGGAADDVTALRPRRDVRTAFLVLNGRKRFRSGPIQLIRVVRR